MKHKLVWPLLVVGLLALGTFSFMSFNENSAAGSYFTPRYFSQPPILGPETYVVPQAEAPVYVMDASSLNPNTCILAREIKRAESMHGIQSTFGCDSMIMYCDSKGW